MKRQIRLIAAVAIFAASVSVATAQTVPAPPPQAQHEAMMREHMQSWQAFTASMVPPPHPDMERRGEGRGAAMTTPQRLDHMAAMMSEHQAAFQRHAEAVRRFYAVLSPQQQKAFDAVSGMMMHHMGRGGPMARHEGMDMEHGGREGMPPPR